ncbi:MAG: AAA family ATPase [Desulfurococcaceae archaeon]|nr:AAA family ATPase [Desulfurococcaceae archaeon]
MVFTTGNKELDILVGEIPQKYMLLIVGHPGAGKTTLASSICYANTLNGYRCLYISFYEDKDKIFNNMAKLGIDLRNAEARNMLIYVKIPVMKPRGILDVLNELIAKDSYRVVVIDSINPIMELYRKKEQRAILLNFFYNLLNTINGLLVAVAEIPWGRESLNLGSIEFISDAIIYLKHRVIQGLLVRVLEVRKSRGSPLNVVEIPFDIAEGRGIVVYVPRNPEKPAISVEEKLRSRVVVDELVGGIYRGDIVTISAPPNARSPWVFMPLLDITIENDSKILIISYKYSPIEIVSLIRSVLVNNMGLSSEEASWVIDRYIHVESVNPASISIPRLANFELRLVEMFKPGIVVFHACEIPWRVMKSVEDVYWTQLINQLIWLENQGVIVVRLISRVDKHFVKMSESLSDLVIRVRYRISGNELKPIWFVWRRGGEPRIIDFSSRDIAEKIIECSKKFKEIIKMRIKTSLPPSTSLHTLQP